MPTVSIVVPVYKAEKTLNACVETYSETFSDFELLLIDDSQPLPADVRYVGRKRPRIHALHPAKTGPGPVRRTQCGAGYQRRLDHDGGQR